jgi:hypothetical protein
MIHGKSLNLNQVSYTDECIVIGADMCVSYPLELKGEGNESGRETVKKQKL